jgi:hypothetical protein
MPKSTYLRNAIYNAIVRNTGYTGPATVYISVHTGNPGAAGANEVAGNAYARVASAWTAPVTGLGTNSASVTTPAPAPAAWGTLTYFGVWDALVGGNFLGYEALTNPIVTSIGVPVTFPAGNLAWLES